MLDIFRRRSSDGSLERFKRMPDGSHAQVVYAENAASASVTAAGTEVIPGSHFVRQLTLTADWSLASAGIVIPLGAIGIMLALGRNDTERTLYTLDGSSPDPITGKGYDWFSALNQQGFLSLDGSANALNNIRVRLTDQGLTPNAVINGHFVALA